MTPPSLSALELRRILADPCAAHALDLCGVVRLPRRLPHSAHWFNWLLRGHHGDLDYMLRDPHGRADPTRTCDWARTLLVFGQRYANGWAKETPPPRGDWLDGVSLYARGRDYHDVLRKAIRRTTLHLRRELHARGLIADEGDLQAIDAVDAGPYLEREYAWLAGLGFYGKNTLLIHPRLGSAFFLGVALLNLEVSGLADAPRPLIGPPAEKLPDPVGPASLCGKCTACLDVCPTDALVEPWSLDAGRCLSTWTIEWRGGAPADRRREQGAWLFGCDLCQDVCPWNHKAARRLLDDPVVPVYGPPPEHAELDLGDLIRIDVETFKARFRHTPLWRSHPEGMRRNALIVAANTGRVDLVGVVRAAAADDPDEAVRETARWALAELEVQAP